MNTYLRFQTSLRCRHSTRPLGIFAAAGRVENSLPVDSPIHIWLDEALSWFNEHLTVPALDEDRWRAIFWFRTEYQQFIARIWELAAILREEGVFTQAIGSNEPGTVIYEDDYQIAAIPTRSKRRRLLSAKQATARRRSQTARRPPAKRF